MCPCVKTSHTERGGRELTCFHSTGRSGSVHTHRCSRGRNWVCERKWKRARKGSAGKRPHTPSRNNLPDKENRVTNDTQIDVCVCVRCFCKVFYYLGHRHRCACSSRRCSGCSQGRCWSRRGQPGRSRLPRGSSGPEPCSRWPRWWTSHPYALPSGAHTCMMKKKRKGEKIQRSGPGK